MIYMKLLGKIFKRKSVELTREDIEEIRSIYKCKMNYTHDSEHYYVVDVCMAVLYCMDRMIEFPEYKEKWQRLCESDVEELLKTIKDDDRKLWNRIMDRA